LTGWAATGYGAALNQSEGIVKGLAHMQPSRAITKMPRDSNKTKQTGHKRETGTI